MRKLFFFSLLPLAFACTDSPVVEPDLAVSPETSVSQAASAQGLAVKMVPLKVSGTYWVTGYGPLGCEGDPAAITLYLELDGNSTHMGSVTGTGTNCFHINPDGSMAILSQTSTQIAANGDAFYGYGSASGDGTEFVVYPDGSWDLGPVPIVGGTGRFENATGWYRISGQTTGGGTFSTVGEISSVGSSK